MRHQATQLATLAMLALAVAGCDPITDFDPDAVDVRAAPAVPPVRTELIDFTASVAVDNHSARTLFIDPSCGWVIEKAIANQWVPAYAADCSAPAVTPTEVEPRSTTIFEIAALAALRNSVLAAPPGEYRVRLEIEASYSRLRNQEVPEESRTSNSFVVD